MLSFWCPEYVHLQRFYGAPTMSIYWTFMMPVHVSLQLRLYGARTASIYWQRFYGSPPDEVNLQRSYSAPRMSINRDFMVPIFRLSSLSFILVSFPPHPTPLFAIYFQILSEREMDCSVYLAIEWRWNKRQLQRKTISVIKDEEDETDGSLN